MSIKSIIFFSFASFCMASCKKSKTNNDTKSRSLPSIEVIYFKGVVETQIAIHCGSMVKPQESSRIVDTFISDTKKCLSIINQIQLLEPRKDDSLPECDIRMQCKIKYLNGDSIELCIDGFNCIIKNGVPIKRNDFLVYLIRKHSGYYNYFSNNELLYFDELKQFGIPIDYKCLKRARTNANGVPLPPE